MKKFLIVGPAWVGDMVMAQGLFILLKQYYCNPSITVIAPDWTRPLLERMPEVDKILPMPFKHGQFSLVERWKLGKSLRDQYYDEAIVLPNSWKSAIIPFAARIPKRTGWHGEMRLGLLNNIYYLTRKNKLIYPLMIQRFMVLSGCDYNTKQMIKPALRIDEQARKNTLEKYSINIDSDKKIIALCPGAEFGNSKRWPKEYYVHIANIILEKNFQVWLMGSQKDNLITKEINKLTEYRCQNLAGKTTLGEAIDLISLASQVITNDSGLMHIAAALQVPLIALYGSTDPGFTPPLSDNANILSITLECRPCFQRECPLKHHRCMKELLPQRVLEIFESCVF